MTVLVRWPVTTLAVLSLLAACSKPAPPTQHADWVIHSRIVFLNADLTAARAALPQSQFRLMFPYIVGDLYGAPTTGDFLQATIGADYRLEIDLNASQAALLVSLEPTDFSVPYLHIEPAQARIARLAPLALQADGIEQIGHADWVDPEAKQRLLLLYVDRASRLSGETVSSSRTLRYDLRMASAGYFWIARQSSPQGDVYRVIPRPAHVVLAITPNDDLNGRSSSATSGRVLARLSATARPYTHN